MYTHLGAVNESFQASGSHEVLVMGVVLSAGQAFNGLNAQAGKSSGKGCGAGIINEQYVSSRGDQPPGLKEDPVA